MRAPLLLLLALASVSHALFFYLEGANPKCFFEELPKDTLVVGHYEASEYDDQLKTWSKNDGLNIVIYVDEVFANDHRVVSQKGAASGRFTFSSHNAGDHKICFTATSTNRQGWQAGDVRLSLDLVVGATNEIESADKTKLEDITTRVKDLSARLQDIRREQVFQREREAEFRDLSESVNSRVIRWILIQLTILGLTCAWQLSHLRSFFIKQKLT